MTTPEQENMMALLAAAQNQPTDITTTDGMESMLALYHQDAKDNADAEELADVDINKLIPTLKMDSDHPCMSMVIGEEPIRPYHGSKQVFLVIVKGIAQRALWAHDGIKDDYKRPICTTGWINTSDIKRGQANGMFLINEDVPYPHVLTDEDGEEVTPQLGDTCQFQCSKCTYDRFGAMADYDPKRPESRAKACGEYRDFIAVLVERGPRLPIEDEDMYAFKLSDRFVSSYNPCGAVLFRLSYGTNAKAIQRMAQQAAIREVSMNALVFKVSNKLEQVGSFSVPQLQHELAGLIVPQDYAKIRGEFRAWADNFVKENATAQGVDSVGGGDAF
jgi:hypothetical protein